MITCKKLSEIAGDHIEAKPTFWARLEYRLHLFMCVDCRRYLRQLKLTIATLQQDQANKEDKPSTEDVDRIVEQLKRDQSTGHSHDK